GTHPEADAIPGEETLHDLALDAVAGVYFVIDAACRIIATQRFEKTDTAGVNQRLQIDSRGETAMDAFCHEADQGEISGDHLLFSLLGRLARSKVALFLLFLRRLHLASLPPSNIRWKKNCTLPLILTRLLVI